MKTYWSASDRSRDWSHRLQVYNSEDDIHSLLIICSFCEDVWEVGGASFTASPELAGTKGQMDAVVACFVCWRGDASGSERNSGSDLSSDYISTVVSLKHRFSQDLWDRPVKIWKNQIQISNEKIVITVVFKMSESLRGCQRFIVLMSFWITATLPPVFILV